MSIRFKLILAYVVMIVFSVTLLVGGMIRTTANFMHNLSESTIGDNTIEEVMESFFNVMVDIEYISRYDNDLINDNDYIQGIEEQLIEFDMYMYFEQDGQLTYTSRYNKIADFEYFYKELSFEEEGAAERQSSENSPFYSATHSYEGVDYLILKHGVDASFADGNIYVMMPKKDMSAVGEDVFAGLFKGIFGVLIIIIVLMTVMITRLVFKPIQVLEESTEKIRQGQLDFSIKTSRNDEIGRVINAFDIMRDELHRSIEKQVQYEENRKELIASISHDLKTPITSIKGYVEGIRDGVASDKDKLDQYLDVIYHKSIDLDQMIDDLFLFSKLDLNRVPFNFVTMDGRRFFEDSYHELKMDLEKVGFQLHYENTLEPSSEIRIDPQQLKRVMMNIVSNAVKYSEERKEVSMKIGTDERDNIHLEIKDYGKGISPEDLKQIFDKFYRCDPARNTDVKGSGLGLAIAKQIVDSHDGQIWAESELGVGTTIHIKCRKITGETDE